MVERGAGWVTGTVLISAALLWLDILYGRTGYALGLLALSVAVDQS
jgi:hypothetical protein